MDGLALLCNLFADGPVTLKRLRMARVQSLGELERAAPSHLAEWLHSSLSQARTFAEEARKLGLRLSEQASRAAPSAEARLPREAARPTTPGNLVLRASLMPSLTEAHCARLQAQGVRTVQALCECAGVTLARRTGIPYSKLLELARDGRRLLGGHPVPARAARSEGQLAEIELKPFVARGRERAPMPEAARSDEFTLPAHEPESAGPFG